MADNTEKPGYTDTPLIPGQSWRVHDAERLHPRVVTPGDAASAGSPSDASVLFDGTDLSAWESLSGGDARWKVADGYMEVVPGTGNICTRAHFGSCQLHVEWTPPAAVEGDSQGRGNSGIFLLGLYEIQVLDCYQNPTYADGSTGAVYGQFPPLVNACRKPGEWQTYDIIFEAPEFEGDRVKHPAQATVILNGILLHHRAKTLGPTGHKDSPVYTPHPVIGPVMLQDHHNPVRFRNIWVRPLTPYDQG